MLSVKKRRKPMNKFILTSIGALLLLTGCGQTSQSTSQPTLPEMKYVLGSNDWSVLKQQSANDKVIEAYQFAVEHPEVLNYMPCYCGCNEEAGHKSNEDCFVKSTTDKEALLDTMGFG
jgi:hypothetical protein